jgi:hypothetical protein
MHQSLISVLKKFVESQKLLADSVKIPGGPAEVVVVPVQRQSLTARFLVLPEQGPELYFLLFRKYHLSIVQPGGYELEVVVLAKLPHQGLRVFSLLFARFLFIYLPIHLPGFDFFHLLECKSTNCLYFSTGK